jgi:hypothetical protein
MCRFDDCPCDECARVEDRGRARLAAYVTAVLLALVLALVLLVVFA